MFEPHVFNTLRNPLKTHDLSFDVACWSWSFLITLKILDSSVAWTCIENKSEHAENAIYVFWVPA